MWYLSLKLNDIKSAILYVIFYLIFCVMVAAMVAAAAVQMVGAAGCLLWLIERHPFNYADSATGAHCSDTLGEGL